MEDRQNDLDSRHAAFVHVNRDTTTVIDNGNAVVFVDRYVNLIAIASQCLIDGVIYNLIDQVVKAALRRTADIHTRTHADSLEPLENLNLLSTVIRIDSCYLSTAFIRMNLDTVRIEIRICKFINRRLDLIWGQVNYFRFLVICHEIPTLPSFRNKTCFRCFLR